MKYNGLDLYEIVFDEDSVFNNIALVTEPAILENFIQLAKQEDGIKMRVDEERRIVSGPALIPEQKIYRNQGGKRFYIKYSKETIQQMALNFFQHHRNTEGNVEHQIPVNGITFFESYLLNKDRGISPVEFADLPDGTWVLSAKVNNDDVWRLVQNGDLNGFSIDISGIKFKDEVKQRKEIDEIDSIEDLLEYIKTNK